MEKTNLIGLINAGYEIIAQGIKAVIGYHKGKKEYVAWTYNYYTNDGSPSFFWGHYFQDYDSAWESFTEKEKNSGCDNR